MSIFLLVIHAWLLKVFCFLNPLYSLILILKCLLHPYFLYLKYIYLHHICVCVFISIFQHFDPTLYSIHLDYSNYFLTSLLTYKLSASNLKYLHVIYSSSCYKVPNTPLLFPSPTAPHCLKIKSNQ